MTVNLRFIYLCFSLLLLLLLQSCASINPTSVADEDRDSSGQFDGRWNLIEQQLRSTQPVTGELFTCNFREQKTYLYVSDGIGRLSKGNSKGTGNIGKDGRFRIVIPTERFFTSSTGIKEEGQRISYIYQGKLALSGTSKGLFTIGKKALNNNGCSTRIVIERAAGTNPIIKSHKRTESLLGRWEFKSENIPGTAKPSSITTSLVIEQKGRLFVGELLNTMTASPSCGELVSSTKTKVAANLITEDSLILTVSDNTVPDAVSCGDTDLGANVYGRYTKILLKFSESEGRQQLAFKSTCGWWIDKACVFQRPPLVKSL